jgi:hypothetical protein
VPIHLPPLRERREDVPLLVDHFLSSATKKFSREPLGAIPEVLDRLQDYTWPGNVRELENCVERMVVLARSSRLSLDDLPPAIRKGPEAQEGAAAGLDLPVGGVSLACGPRPSFSGSPTRPCSTGSGSTVSSPRRARRSAGPPRPAKIPTSSPNLSPTSCSGRPVWGGSAPFGVTPANSGARDASPVRLRRWHGRCSSGVEDPGR